MFVAEDLEDGKRFAVPNQGSKLSPVWGYAVIVWVLRGTVRYTLSGFDGVKPVAEFLKLVNAEPNGPHVDSKPRV